MNISKKKKNVFVFVLNVTEKLKAIKIKQSKFVKTAFTFIVISVNIKVDQVDLN